jgi:pyruvate-formate lyase-activating enzyme
VKEEMRVTIEEEIPFTMVWRKLGEEEAMLEVMIDVVPTDPPMFDVKTLLDDDKVLLVFKVVMVADAVVRSVIEVVASDTVPVAVRLPTVRALSAGEEERERTLPDQRRLEPAEIRVDGVV